jgi:hypothetical protein
MVHHAPAVLIASVDVMVMQQRQWQSWWHAQVYTHAGPKGQVGMSLGGMLAGAATYVMQLGQWQAAGEQLKAACAR